MSLEDFFQDFTVATIAIFSVEAASNKEKCNNLIMVSLLLCLAPYSSHYLVYLAHRPSFNSVPLFGVQIQASFLGRL